MRRYRAEGPLPTTRALIDALRTLGGGIAGTELLDIGAGVGAIHHALVENGAARAVHVDLSVDYIDVAREEAARRGHDRVEFVAGDFVELASQLEDADVVTLDRVICCYPDMEGLVQRAAGKARRLFGAVYPRMTLWTQIAFSFTNILARIRRKEFRLYVHSPAAIDVALGRMGFERRSLQRTWIWEMVVYVRRSMPQSENHSPRGVS